MAIICRVSRTHRAKWRLLSRHGVIVISNRNRGHDCDYDCELVIVIDYIHRKYNVIAIVIDYFTKVIEIMITYHDYMIFFP